jgi:hypothetical protein
MPAELKEAPANACRFAAGPVKFAAAGNNGNVPIHILARSNEPIDHWYWGRVVHDMAGMQLSKPTIPIDYEHCDPIGFANKFAAAKDGLEVDGELVPTELEDDPCPLLIERSRRGVPYEASIYFGDEGIKLEFIAENQITEVNGQQMEGPLTVIREWTLRGVAVCPYGADMATASEFSSKEKFSLSYLEKDMKTAPNATKLSDTPAADPAAAPAVTPAAGEAKPAEATPAVGGTPTDAPAPAAAAATSELSADRKEAKRFKDRFGDKGAAWFADGLSFEEAQQKHESELSARVAELEKKLSAASQPPNGETTRPASAAPATKARSATASPPKSKCPARSKPRDATLSPLDANAAPKS